MRVAIVGNGLPHTDTYPNPQVGGSIQTWIMAKELAAYGHDITIIRRSNKRDYVKDGVRLKSIDFWSFDKCLFPRNKIFSLLSFGIRFYFGYLAFLFIEQQDFDAVWLIDRISGFYPARLKIPYLYVLHSPDAMDVFYPAASGWNFLHILTFAVKKKFETAILDHSNLIIVPNASMLNYFKRRYSARFVKIPHAVNYLWFQNRSDNNYILYCGRFDWNKNVLSLVKAFSVIKKRFSNIDLVLVGSGPERDNILSYIESNDLKPRVKLVPWIPHNQIKKLMSACSLFVLPSKFETFGIVVLEAMASSKAVIAKSSFGTRDIIEHEKTGYLYDSSEELIRYLELLLMDEVLRNRIGSQSRKAVTERFTPAKIAQLYHQALEEMLD